MFLIAIKGVTSPRLLEYADEVLWLYVTQIGKAIRECRKRRASKIIMAGRVSHNAIFSISPWNMDFTSLRVWWSLPDKRPDTILSGIADAFVRKGIHVMSSVHYISSYLAKEGVLTKKKPSKAVSKDIDFGVKIAKAMGDMDVGQTVVVKDKATVAIEAMEGTDQCLERAGTVAGEGCVVVKMPKPGQDMRFDVPTVGVNTIEKLHKIKAAALAIESERTLLIDEETIDVANKYGIVIVSLPQKVTE